MSTQPITTRPGRSTAVRIGSAFISLIEPEVGYEREFNRWYADDHFYGGAMCLPWFFAGRRWVATRRLKDLRYPRESAFAKSNALGCYLHTYWIEDEHLDDMAPVLGKALTELTDSGRMFVEGKNFRRSHVYSAFQPYAGVIYRDADEGAPRDIHALDYPYQGLVLEVIDTLPQKSRPDLLTWLQGTFIPRAIQGSGAHMCLVFMHAPTPAAVSSGITKAPPGSSKASPDLEGRVTLLWFIDDHPEKVWSRDFTSHGTMIDASGLGRLQFAGPFIPTLAGSDKYSDELR